MSKRTLDSFFRASPAKKQKLSPEPKSTPNTQSEAPTQDSLTAAINASLATDDLSIPSSKHPDTHPTYAFPIPHLPEALAEALTIAIPGHDGKAINHASDLDLLYFQPFIPRPAANALFHFLRSSLPFYRVKYTIKRGGQETQINTPRYTTVFGLDASAYFQTPNSPDSTTTTTTTTILDAKTNKPIPPSAYASAPRPIPACLDLLRRLTEAFTGAEYNFVLVNYYASGQDSISYHSDDEKFLGHEPAIASLSLGSTRDFLMRHKPLARDAGKDATAGVRGNRGTVGVRGGKGGENGGGRRGDGGDGGGGGGGGGGEAGSETLTPEEEAVREAHRNPLKLPMAGGDMVLMRGRSQSHWLHSVPKRSGKGVEGGRINITFRKALVKAGTENYYQYNVGRGPPMVWDGVKKEMVEWQPLSNNRGGTEIGGQEVKTKEMDDEAWTRKSTKYGVPFERKWQEK